MKATAGSGNSGASKTPQRESQRHTWPAERKAKVFAFVKQTTEKPWALGAWIVSRETDRIRPRICIGGWRLLASI